MVFENTYCNCTGKYDSPPWCGRWSKDRNETYCVLNGGLKSIFCPKAKPYIRSVDSYISSHPSVCKKALRKLLTFTQL